MKKVRMTALSVVGSAAAIVALSACSPVDTNYHGKVRDTEAPVSTVSTPSVPAYPVTINGSGEQVETADLVATGYTVRYQASDWTLSVFPVRADGSDSVMYVVNAIGREPSSGVTGTTTYRATGRTTFHVANTRGSWSLTFTPLS